MAENTLQPGWVAWPTKEGWWWAKAAPGEKARPVYARETRSGIVVDRSHIMYLKGDCPDWQFFPVLPPPENATIEMARSGRAKVICGPIQVIAEEGYVGNKQPQRVLFEPAHEAIMHAQAIHLAAVLLDAERQGK